MTVECSDSAYYRIKGSEIEQKILIVGKELGSLTEDAPYTTKGERIINNAIKRLFSNNRISEIDYIYRDIAELASVIEDESYMRYKFEDVCVDHPSFLAYYILRKELLNYEKFSFPSSRSLEDAVVSYYFGERESISSCFGSEYFIWRNNGKKNVLHQDMHGDMYVSQHDVSGNEREELTLFGPKIVFDSAKINPDGGGVYGYQDWSGYLLAALKFAERLGKPKMPEIIEWHDYYKKTHHGGNYGEAGDDANFGIQQFTERPVISKGERLNNFPIAIIGMNFGTVNSCKYPYFEGDKLFYIQEDKEGNIDLSETAPFFKDKKFSKTAEYTEADLPNILKGCYKLFSRVVANMFFIMKDFNKKHK